MARFYGKVGYATDSVESPEDSGIFEDQIVEYPYYGDVVRNSRRLDPGENLNSDISIGNSISIVADQFANEHFHAIRYVEWSGVLWTVTSVEVQAPRLILSVGEVYNGPVAPPPEVP